MSKKKLKFHPTDGLNGLCIYFDGKFKDPMLSKIKPFILAFGGRIFTGLDERINCVVKGSNPLVSDSELLKYPKLKIIDYQSFLKSYFSEGNYF